MKKLLLLSSMSLFIIIFAGCADCENESDYDYVGVTLDEFLAKSGIKGTPSNGTCKANTTQGVTAKPNNPSRAGINQGFVIQAGNYMFDLQKTIQALFPQEAHKDDKFESCNDYYVYDFLADYHRSPKSLEINSINVDENYNNTWNVEINGICYQWDVTGTQYAIIK